MASITLEGLKKTYAGNVAAVRAANGQPAGAGRLSDLASPGGSDQS